MNTIRLWFLVVFYKQMKLKNTQQEKLRNYLPVYCDKTKSYNALLIQLHDLIEFDYLFVGLFEFNSAGIHTFAVPHVQKLFVGIVRQHSQDSIT